MAQPTIDNVRAAADFSTLYQWDLAIRPPVVMAAPDSFELNVRCESAEIPVATNQSIEVMIRGHKVKQPGIQQYNGQFTLVFVESNEGSPISNFLTNWREIIWSSRSGYQFSKREVEAGFLLTRLDRQLSPVWRYEMIGCYLEDYQLGTLDGSSSEAFKPSLVFSYDYFLDGP